MPQRFEPFARRIFALMGMLACAACGSADAQIPLGKLWITDGPVKAIAKSGNTIYVGGQFTRVGRATGPLFMMDAVTGAVKEPFPLVAGGGADGISDGNGGWFIGGLFTSVQGRPRYRLAHLDAAGNLTPWAVYPGPPDGVRSMALSGNTLYVGGLYSIKAYDATTGATLPWTPGETIDGYVDAIAVDGGRVYAGNRGRLTAFDAASGAVRWSKSIYVNGQELVEALAIRDHILYVGGQFPQIGDVVRNNLAALVDSTGEATSWSTGTNNFGLIYRIQLEGGRVYVTGDFSSIGGQSRSRVAALDLAGNVLPWNPQPTGFIYGLAPRGDAVYLSGSFTALGGQPRKYIATVDTAAGAPTAWSSPIDAPAYGCVLADGVLCLGTSTFPVGQARHDLAAFDATTGEVTNWNPNPQWPATDTLGIESIAVSGGTVYVGGRFSAVGGQARFNVAALDAATGAATGWAADTDPGGDVTGLAVHGRTIYATGRFSTIGGLSRKGLAALDVATGAVASWNPSPNTVPSALAAGSGVVYVGGSFASIGGQPRSSIAAIDSVTGQAAAWNPIANHAVRALALRGGLVYAGGDFTTIGGFVRNRAAALNSVTGVATTWNPNADNTVTGFAFSSSAIYARGAFNSIGGGPSRVAQLDPATGLANAWGLGFPLPGSIDALLVDDAIVYVGGEFEDAGGLPNANFAGLTESGVVAVDGPPSAVPAGILRAWPNPTAGATTLRFAVPQRTDIDVDVFDLAGRLVRPLHRGMLPSGEAEFAWDGRDRTGRRVSAGIYLVRAHGTNVDLRAKLLRMR